MAINSSAINDTAINGLSSADPFDSGSGAYSGCAAVIVPNGIGSGTLLWDRRTILTAAHVVYGITPAQYSQISITFNSDAVITAPEVFGIVIHNGYSPTKPDNDLAVIILKDPVPLSIRAYKLYTDFDEVGRVFTKVGYSGVRDPVTGIWDGVTVDWHSVTNKYEATSAEQNALSGVMQITPDSSQLLYDFDDGTTTHDAIGGLLSIPDLGIVGESAARPGDSGSASFFALDTVNGSELRIAGTTRGAWALAPYDITPGVGDGSYGELANDMRVSTYVRWISAAVGARDGVLTVTQSASLEAYGDVISSDRESLLVQAVSGFQATGGGALTVFEAVSFTIEATAWSVGTLAVIEGGTEFDTVGSSSPPFFFGGAYTNLTQPSGTFTGYSAASTVLGLTIGVSSFAATGISGTASQPFVFIQQQNFVAVGAGSLVTGQSLGAFTSIALTGSTARLIVEQRSAFASVGNVVNTLGVMSVTQPAMVANYGLMVVEQAQMFSGGTTTVENNLIAYSMNIQTTETTTYSNYNFKFIIRLGHEYYGVKSDGLYELSGSTDDGAAINAQFKTAETDFGSTQLKRVPFVYLDSDTDATVSSIADGVANDAVAAAFNGRRTHLARGPKGRFWQMEVANVNGSELKVGSLEIMAELLSRKV